MCFAAAAVPKKLNGLAFQNTKRCALDVRQLASKKNWCRQMTAKSGNGASGEACNSFYKNLLQVDGCMGPDTLAVDESLVEIDLSAEFPPERREAQEDLAAPYAQRERCRRVCLVPAAPSRVVTKWWAEANAAAVKGLQGATTVARLLDVRVVKPLEMNDADDRSPWHPGQSEELYKAMGLRAGPASVIGGGPAYVALWLGLGSSSLLCFAQATDRRRLGAAVAGDPLMQRLKLILNPLRMAVPWPQKAPKDVAPLGTYFGLQNASCTRARTSWGADYVCIHVDLHAKMLLRLLLQNVVFRKGNVIELLMVDWPGKSVLASCRITMTREALQLLAPDRNPASDLGL